MKMAGTRSHEEKQQNLSVETGIDHDRCEMTDAGFE